MGHLTPEAEKNSAAAGDRLAATMDLPPFYRLAEEESALNRRELSKLYSESADVIGEVRYDLLWRLSEISRISSTLDYMAAASDLPPNEDEISQVRERIAQLALEAVQMRQEARTLLNAYQKENVRHAEATAQRLSRASRNSTRYTYTSAAF